jgi:hypothetical protein
MRPSRVDILAAVLAAPSGITTRQLAVKLATVPHQIRPNLSKLAAYGHISKTVISPRGDAVWGPISPPTISSELPAASCLALESPVHVILRRQAGSCPGGPGRGGTTRPFALKKPPTIEAG